MVENNPFASIGLSKPAQRALANAGISELKKLSGFTVKEISALHGIGPSAIPKLTAALRSAGFNFVKTKSDMNDSEKVAEYMEKLKHPLKAEIELVRKIIKSSDKKLSERIKWNAPSYYYKEDLVTFNPRKQDAVHLVFHHPSIVKISSQLLEGEYKDRRMTYFKDSKQIKAGKKELQRVMKKLISSIK